MRPMIPDHFGEFTPEQFEAQFNTKFYDLVGTLKDDFGIDSLCWFHNFPSEIADQPDLPDLRVYIMFNYKGQGYTIYCREHGPTMINIYRHGEPKDINYYDMHTNNLIYFIPHETEAPGVEERQQRLYRSLFGLNEDQHELLPLAPIRMADLVHDPVKYIYLRHKDTVIMQKED
jgi:hypothetical protein